MSEYVRVRDKETGHHLSVLRSQFDFNPEAFSELKQDATYADGDPLPPKHKTSVSQEAANKPGKAPADNGQSADTSKEK